MPDAIVSPCYPLSIFCGNIVMELTTSNQLSMAFPALAVASSLEAESRQHRNRAFAFPETMGKCVWETMEPSCVAL